MSKSFIDNKKLQKLLDVDQCSRENPKNINWDVVSQDDADRRKQVKRMMSRGTIRTAKDYYNAGLIFQHGSTTDDFKQAQKLALTAMEMGYEPARWLYAATTDRLLISLNCKQRYCTQYTTIERVTQDIKKVSVLLQPYDKRISDSTRVLFTGRTLQDALDAIPHMEKLFS